MTVGDLEADRQPDRRTQLIEVIRSRMLSIAFLLLLSVAIGAGLIHWFGVPSPGRRSIMALLIFLITTPWFILGAIVAWLFWPSPDNQLVIDFDVLDLPGSNVAAVYELTPADFRELEVREGELDQLAPTLWAGKGLDLDGLSVVGTWTGTASDAELMRHLNNVYLIRERLDPKAKKWERLSPILDWLVRADAADQTEDVMHALQNRILPGEAEKRAGQRLDDWMDEELKADADDVDETDLSDAVEENVPDALGPDLDVDADGGGPDGGL